MEIKKGDCFTVKTYAPTRYLDENGERIYVDRTEDVVVNRVARYKSGAFKVRVDTGRGWYSVDFRNATVNPDGSIKVSDAVTFIRK